MVVELVLKPAVDQLFDARLAEACGNTERLVSLVRTKTVKVSAGLVTPLVTTLVRAI